jgi:excisionase family DNA binding protein
MSGDHLINVREVAEYIGMAVGSVYHLVSEGRIPCIHLSARCLRFRRSDIDAWINAKANDPAAPTLRKGGLTR